MNDQILFGTYRICGALGNGSHSVVYLVKHILLKQFRAIKCTPKPIPGSDRSDFQQSHEPQILESVKHACIPVLYDYCEDADYCYLVEEYIQGDTLDVYLRERKKISYLSFCKIASALSDVALCLYESENRYVYTEWKPKHVKIMGDQVHLLDFSGGYCKSVQKRSYDKNTQCQKRPDVYGLAKLLLFVEQYVDRCKNESKMLLELCAEKPGDNGPTMEQFKDYFNREIDSFTADSDTCTDTSNKKIAVLGSKHGVGTTHFAISLSVYLRMRGMNSAYLGKPCIIDGIAEYRPHSQSSDEGVICAGFKGMIQGTDAPGDLITINDMGVFTDWNIRLEECDDIFVILGSNPWEIEESLEAFERLKYKSGLHFLVCYGNVRMAKWYTGKLHRSVGCFPLDADPFSSDDKKTEFFGALL